MTINANCKLNFMELKEKRTYMFIVYKIDENRNQVIEEKFGDISQGHDNFIACFPVEKCRFVVFDFEYLIERNVPMSRILFIRW
jgi:cofilin